MLSSEERYVIQVNCNSDPQSPPFVIAKGAMLMLDTLLHEDTNDTATAYAVANATVFCLKDIQFGRNPEDHDYHAISQLIKTFTSIKERLP